MKTNQAIPRKARIDRKKKNLHRIAETNRKHKDGIIQNLNELHPPVKRTKTACLDTQKSPTNVL